MTHPEAYRFWRRERELDLDGRAPRDDARAGARAAGAEHRRGVRRASTAIGAAVVLGSAVLVPRALSRGPAADLPGSVALAFAYQEPALLAAAFRLPVASAYGRAGIDVQRNGTFCGPATAAGVARSLGARVDQRDVLDGTGVRAPLGILWRGVTLDEEARIVARATGRRVTVLRDLDLAAFREELSHANDADRRYVVNFSRVPLFGRGGGHHSPIGGYLPDRDLVLVLDVNGDYGPWLVPTERLFRAVDTVDRVTGRKRGLLRVE